MRILFDSPDVYTIPVHKPEGVACGRNVSQVTSNYTSDFDSIKKAANSLNTYRRQKENKALDHPLPSTTTQIKVILYGEHITDIIKH